MGRPKKTEDLDATDVEATEVEAAEVVSEFPYTVELKSTCEVITVVSEGVDAQGRKTLLTDTGCIYHAE